MGGILQAFAGHDRRRLRAAAADVRHARRAPDARAAVRASARYQPMVELLRYLEANGFTTYIASGGDRDFMRADRRARSTASRPSASSAARTRSRYDEDDDGDRRVPRRARRVRRRAGQAGADLEPHRPAADRRRRQLERRHPDAALRRRRDRPALRLLVLHDDAEREFDYTAGAETGAATGGGRRVDGRQHEERLVARVRRQPVTAPRCRPSESPRGCAGYDRAWLSQGHRGGPGGGRRRHPPGDGLRHDRRAAGAGRALHVHGADGGVRPARRLAHAVGQHDLDDRRAHRVDA